MQAQATTSAAHEKKDSSLSLPEAKEMVKNQHLSSMTAASAETARSTTSKGFDPYSKEQCIYEWHTEDALCNDQVKMVEMCNGYAEGTAKKHFDYLAPNYDGIYNYLGYPDPEKVAQMCAKHAKKIGKSPRDLKVLDIGCGTGLVGEQLQRLGFC